MSERFGGYSIVHVNGRYRRGPLLDRVHRVRLRGEAEVIEQALTDPGLRHLGRRGAGFPSGVGHQDLRVIGLALVTRLKCPLQPDHPRRGQEAAR